MDSPNIIIIRMLKLGKYSKQENLATTLGITPGALSDYKKKEFLQNHLIKKYLNKHSSIDEIELCYGKKQSKLHIKDNERLLIETWRKIIVLEELDRDLALLQKKQQILLDKILIYKLPSEEFISKSLKNKYVRHDLSLESSTKYHNLRIGFCFKDDDSLEVCSNCFNCEFFVTNKEFKYQILYIRNIIKEMFQFITYDNLDEAGLNFLPTLKQIDVYLDKMN